MRDAVDFGFDLIEYARQGELRPAVHNAELVRKIDGTGPEAMYVSNVSDGRAFCVWYEYEPTRYSWPEIRFHAASFALADLEPSSFVWDRTGPLIVKDRQ